VSDLPNLSPGISAIGYRGEKTNFAEKIIICRGSTTFHVYDNRAEIKKAPLYAVLYMGAQSK
jgi:hypothetical protein